MNLSLFASDQTISFPATTCFLLKLKMNNVLWSIIWDTLQLQMNSLYRFFLQTARQRSRCLDAVIIFKPKKILALSDFVCEWPKNET